MPNNTENLQRARDIVADAFVAQQIADVAGLVARSHNGSFAAWGEFVDSYARFMRGGAYDSEIAVQAALTALSEAQREAA